MVTFNTYKIVTDNIIKKKPGKINSSFIIFLISIFDRNVLLL